MATHAGSRFRVVEVEGFEFGCTQMILLFLILKSLLESLLETLEIWNWLSLSRLEGKLVLIHTIFDSSGLHLISLPFLVFLHPRGQL